MKLLRFSPRLKNLLNPLFLLPILKFTIQEESMLPTLKPGDTVLTWRFGTPKVGDIVVAKHEGKFLIKRIKEIKALNNSRELFNRLNQGKKYFIIGDNEKYSTDSRQFGWVNQPEIIGVVFNLFIL